MKYVEATTMMIASIQVSVDPNQSFS